jgi:uronate dehydrogenase
MSCGTGRCPVSRAGVVAESLGRLLITGAAGGVGTMLREGLRGRADEVVLFDQRAIEAGDGERAVVGDVNDLDAVRRAIAGCDACVHLAAIPVEAQFEEILHANIRGTWALFEAARMEGCRRVVFASSNHATGFRSVDDQVDSAAPVRPDTYYGVSKVFGEALGNLYHDKFGLRVACIRIGTALPRPLEERHLSTWLSPGDLTRLVTACLVSPDLGFAIVYGVSANRRRWWDLEAGGRLGYEPEDDAEAYASEVEKNPVGRFQGGPKFTDPGTTP